MRELTQEIKEKIKAIAITKLQNGNALLVVNKDEVDMYEKVLSNLYINEELEIE